MADIPEPLQYGTVEVFAYSPLADSTDAGDRPDLVGLTGSVDITPLLPKWKVVDGDGKSLLFTSKTITCRLDQGVVYAPDTEANVPVRLLASRTAGLSAGLEAVQYTATIRPTMGERITVSRFEIPVNGAVNLADQLDYTSSAVITVVSEATRVAAEDAAARAEAAADEATTSTDEKVTAAINDTAWGGALDGVGTNPGLNTAAVDNLVAGRIDDPASATAQALSATTAAVQSGRPGVCAVSLGDSNTIYQDSTTSHGAAWPRYAAIKSRGRFNLIHNAGVGGDTLADMLARFDTDVTAYAPNLVTIMGGTNQTNGTLEQFRNEITELVARVRGIGAVPVLATIPPKDGAEAAVTLWNLWLTGYAAAEGLTLLPVYDVLVDPTTGGIRAAYSAGDGIHFNAAGHAAVADAVITTLAPLLPAWSPMLTQAATDPYNQIDGGLMLGEIRPDEAPNGAYYIGGSAAAFVGSVATGDVQGQWWQADIPGGGGEFSLIQYGLHPTPGHVLHIAARIDSDLTAGDLRIQLDLRNADYSVYSPVYPLFDATEPLDGIVTMRVTVPAGVTDGELQFRVSAGAAGRVRIGQVTIYDLTDLTA